MAYQSFPWQGGDSRSFAKLMALDLPLLAGKSVLDVGCNSGFFCGYAAWNGAANVVGIDASAASIDMAKSLFPQCRFICGDWTSLDPAEKYDVIIFLSAIHYAADQKGMLDFLVQHLKPGGLLVLEIGIAPGDTDEFVEVRRSIDKRFFPTRKKLDSMLKDFAVKQIGKSPSQIGDPIPRHVFHIRHKQPLAILLMDTPHSGKSAVSTSIFDSKIQRLSGDVLYYEIMHGVRDAPPPVVAIINEWREGQELNCAAVTYKICRSGLVDELCALVRAYAGGNDFILDMYITPPCREKVMLNLEQNGFFVIDVSLFRARSRPHAKEAGNRDDCVKYMEYLQKEVAQRLRK